MDYTATHVKESATGLRVTAFKVRGGDVLPGREQELDIRPHPEPFRTATAPFATGLSEVNMNCKGKSVNKNQASAQLNRYWHNRTESPHTAKAPGFFADREDRDLRRRPKTPATDSARRTSELLKKVITPSRNKAGPALGRAAFRPPAWTGGKRPKRLSSCS